MQTQTQEAVPVGATTTTKKCRLCRFVKPLAEFPRNASASSLDGRRPDCTRCYNAARRGEPSRRTESAALPVKIYTRNCNRCDRRYTGPTRLLCAPCFRLASGAGGMDAGLATSGRVPRRGGA